MAILTCGDINLDHLRKLLNKFALNINIIEDNTSISGSWFGDPEAGLIKNNLYLRLDTPVHSALHESCHYICMDQTRRKNLHTNVGGDFDEENAVCYLQILLADFIPQMGRDRMLLDMDEWGYTFRLGSSRAWFEQDAEDACDWLSHHKLINEAKQPLWTLRK